MSKKMEDGLGNQQPIKLDLYTSILNGIEEDFADLLGEVNDEEVTKAGFAICSIKRQLERFRDTKENGVAPEAPKP
ncbi:hypothetical protein [Roseovarius sp. MMSF_3281]|uniref:hypothetical protein n=1 Tax=Roseovarius sp. MMSF_3281 TaxID=3046694 RepID=UPI00273FB7B2|nr:hypothetical protein [Roseovarius sp. MMSF_3281]